MSSRTHIVYLSFDGLLEPLGYSQVARVVMALAAGGQRRFTICSLEKEAHRADGAKERQLAAQLRRHQVRWRRATWTAGGTPLAVAKNVQAMAGLAEPVVAGGAVDLLHARSYVAATVARRLGGRHGIPYLFDMRGFWVDERLERGLWFNGPLRRRLARRWEAALVADAAAAVTLTEGAAQDLIDQRLGPWPEHRPRVVIPTTVDYSDFGLAAATPAKMPAALRQSSLVVGYIGSVNPAYDVEASLRLFDHLRRLRPDAHLLGLTAQPERLLSHLGRLRLPPQSYTVRAVEHRQMPQWLAQVDWGLLLRKTCESDRSYRGAMPTKLGEFFAAGIRPVYAGHNQEVRQWIAYAGSGHLIDTCDETGLKEAAQVMAQTGRSRQALWGARWRTRGHFGLGRALEGYHGIYDQIVARQGPGPQVLFVVADDECQQWRIDQWVPHLKDRGLQCTVWARPPQDSPAAALSALAALWGAHRFDVVVVQPGQTAMARLLQRWLRWRSAALVCDLSGPHWKAVARRGRPEEALKDWLARSPHCLCDSSDLVRWVGGQAATTEVPTAIDSRRWQRPVPRRMPPSAPVVVGWRAPGPAPAASASIRSVLEGLCQGEAAQVAIFEDRPGVGDPSPLSEALLAPGSAPKPAPEAVDIALVVAEDGGERARLQALEWMARGVAVVALGREGLADLGGRQRGVWATESVAEARAALAALIADGPRAQRQGQRGQARVVAEYDVGPIIDDVVTTLVAAAQGHQAAGRAGQAAGAVGQPVRAGSP